MSESQRVRKLVQKPEGSQRQRATKTFCVICAVSAFVSQQIYPEYPHRLVSRLLLTCAPRASAVSQHQ